MDAEDVADDGVLALVDACSTVPDKYAGRTVDSTLPAVVVMFGIEVLAVSTDAFAERGSSGMRIPEAIEKRQIKCSRIFFCPSLGSIFGELVFLFTLSHQRSNGLEKQRDFGNATMRGWR